MPASASHSPPMPKTAPVSPRARANLSPTAAYTSPFSYRRFSASRLSDTRSSAGGDDADKDDRRADSSLDERERSYERGMYGSSGAGGGAGRWSDPRYGTPSWRLGFSNERGAAGVDSAIDEEAIVDEEVDRKASGPHQAVNEDKDELESTTGGSVSNRDGSAPVGDVADGADGDIKKRGRKPAGRRAAEEDNEPSPAKKRKGEWQSRLLLRED